MRAVYFEEFQKDVVVQTLDDPTPDSHGVVLRVEATGLCRSDWHGWMGHDTEISCHVFQDMNLQGRLL